MSRSRRAGWRRNLIRAEEPRDEGLRVLLDLPEMRFAQEAFSIEFVDFLGSGGPRGEPAVGGGDLDPADRLVVARGAVEFRDDRLSRQFLHVGAGGIQL